MASQNGNIPAIPVVRPNGRCYCGCGETTKPGKSA